MKFNKFLNNYFVKLILTCITVGFLVFRIFLNITLPVTFNTILAVAVMVALSALVILLSINKLQDNTKVRSAFVLSILIILAVCEFNYFFRVLSDNDIILNYRGTIIRTVSEVLSAISLMMYLFMLRNYPTLKGNENRTDKAKIGSCVVYLLAMVFGVALIVVNFMTYNLLTFNVYIDLSLRFIANIGLLFIVGSNLVKE